MITSDNSFNSYLFSLRQTTDPDSLSSSKISIDSFYKLPNWINLDEDSMKCAIQLMEANDQTSELHEVQTVVHSMSFRSRFNADIIPKIFKVMTKEELSSDTLLMVIESKIHDGTIDQFLNDATVMRA